MRVSDFDLDWEYGGLFTCCMSHVMEDNRQAHEGMVIRCAHCKKKLTLTKCSDGKLRWRAAK